MQEETHWTLIESLPHLSMRVRSHGERLQSQQATLVGLTLTNSGQIGIVIPKMKTILVQNSKLKILFMNETQNLP